MTDRESLLRLLEADNSVDGDTSSLDLDSRWEALADGTITDTEHAALQAQARDAEQSDLHAAAQEAFAPLGADFLDRVEAALPPTSADIPQNVVPLWRRLAGPTALLAAALALLVLLPSTPSLPDYTLAVNGGDVPIRGDHIPSKLYSPGSTIDVRLIPDEATQTEAEAWVAVDTWDATLSVPLEHGEGGAIRLRGTIGDSPWLLEPGSHNLLITIGPAGASEPSPTWQRWSVPVEVSQ